jgi:hypothetical protein
LPHPDGDDDQTSSRGRKIVRILTIFLVATAKSWFY